MRAPYGTFGDIEGDLWVDGKAVTFTNLTGTGFGGALTGRLWIAADTDARHGGPAILFDGAAVGVDARTLAGTFTRSGRRDDALRKALDGVDGRLSGTVSVAVDPSKRVTIMANPRGPMVLTGVSGSITGGSMKVTITGDRVEATADRLALALPEGVFHAGGSWRNTGEVRLSVRGADVDLAALGLRLGRNDLAGRGAFAGTLDGPLTTARFSGAARFTDLIVAGRAVPRAYADLFGALGPSPWVGIRDMRIGMGDTEGRLEAALRPGEDGRWRVSGQLRIPPTGVATLSALAGMALPLEGFTDGEVTFADLPDRGQGQARVVLHGPRLRLGNRSIACDEVSADVSLGPRGVEVSEATVVYQSTPFFVRGTMAPDPDARGTQRLTARVRAPLVMVDVLRAMAGEALGAAGMTADADLPIDIDGDMAVTANITARITTPTGEPAVLDPASLVIGGDIVRARRLEIGGVPFRGFAAEVEYHAARRTVTVSGFSLNREDPRSGRNYALALAGPSTFNLADGTLDMHMSLPTMHLEELRRDLVLMGRNQQWEEEALAAAPVPSPFARAHAARHLPAMVARFADAVPPAFSAEANADIDIFGPLGSPTVRAAFSLHEMRMARSRLPDVRGQVAYATSTGTLDITQLSAHGMPNARGDMFTADLSGSIALPGAATDGLRPGTLRMTVNAQHIDPQEVARWVGNPAVAAFGGDADIAADISGTPEEPTIIATIAVRRPALPGLEFDGLTATLALDHGRLFIGNRFLGREHGAAIVDLKGSVATGRKPLGVFGFIPLRFDGFTPYIPQNEPADIWVTLPEQSLDVARDYLSWLPRGEGTLAASAHIRGTMAQPEVPEGDVRLTAPELVLPYEDADLPNRLRDVTLDAHIQAIPSGKGGFTNVVEMRDLSAVYDRVASVGPRKPDPQFIRWARARLGLNRKTRQPFTPGAVVAQGTVKLVTEEGAPIPLGDFLNPLVRTERRTELLAAVLRRLQYDVYAKTVHTPVRWRDMFQGTLTAYAHLGNRYDAQGKPVRPLLTGVVYVEDATGTYTAPTGAPPEAMLLPLDPELSMAVQVGPNCAFAIGPDNVLFSSTFSGSFPFQPSDVFSPISQADLAILAHGKAAKPPVEPEHQAYVYTADTLRPYGGTHGRVMGTLSKPTLVGDYALIPRRAQAVFPRGRLTIDNSGGTLRYTLGEPLYLYGKGEASGQVDDYRIAATVDGNILQALESGMPTDPFERHLPITFVVTSAPKGAPPLTDAQIYTRLVGVTDLVAVLEGRQDVWSPLSTIGRDVLLRNSFDRLARTVGLESFAVNFATGGNPEFTATTPELGRPERGTFRIGTTRELASDPNWKLWVDLRLPQYRWLREMGMTVQTDTREGQNVSLSWRRPF
jgi:hypothetical protein